MTLENRRPIIFSSGSHRHSCSARASSSVLVSEYVLSGRGGYCSSTGMYGGGVSNGSPSTVSLDAHTMFFTPARRAADTTLNELFMLLAKVAWSPTTPGAGIAA